MAYYWSSFYVPESDLEMVPQLSELRVLQTLESGLKDSRSVKAPRSLKITEITATCRYCQSRGQGGGGSRQGAEV